MAAGNNVLNALLVVTGLLVVLGILFAAPLVTAYAGDFAAVPGKLELTVTLARVMFPFLVLVALAAAVMGMLNSLRHYFVPSLAPATFNVAASSCAFALTPLMPRLGLAADHVDGDRRACSAVSGSCWSSGRRSGARVSATARCSIRATPGCAECSC